LLEVLVAMTRQIEDRHRQIEVACLEKYPETSGGGGLFNLRRDRGDALRATGRSAQGAELEEEGPPQSSSHLGSSEEERVSGQCVESQWEHRQRNGCVEFAKVAGLGDRVKLLGCLADSRFYRVELIQISKPELI
jgi:hypothetical protein